MDTQNLKLPAGGWRRVVAKTALTTVGVSMAATAFAHLINVLSNQPTTASDVWGTVLICMVLVPPIAGTLFLKLLQLRVLTTRLHILATTDSLTGALNRAAFTARVEAAMSHRSAEDAHTHDALLVFDIDRFKLINDRYGHLVGDEALAAVADAIRRSLRDDDLFARLGGEEFAAYLPDTSPDIALSVAERCRTAVRNRPLAEQGDQYRVSISIGVGVIGPTSTFTSVYRDADQRLYEAKANGRDRVEMRLRPAA